MLLEIFILLEIVNITIFLIAFFTKQEILWAIALVTSGIMMFTSYNIQQYIYKFDSVTGAYNSVLVSTSHPYLMGFHMIFFALSLVLGFSDVFEKYGVPQALKKLKGKF